MPPGEGSAKGFGVSDVLLKFEQFCQSDYKDHANLLAGGAMTLDGVV